MLVKLYHITINHYNAAIEHIANNPAIRHTPTYFQAFRIAIYDMIFKNVVYDKESTSYVVYENVSNPTLGLSIKLVVRLYTPPKYRGAGIINKLLDKIEGTVVSNKGEYGEVGRLYVCRKIL